MDFAYAKSAGDQGSPLHSFFKGSIQQHFFFVGQLPSQDFFQQAVQGLSQDGAGGEAQRHQIRALHRQGFEGKSAAAA